MPDPGIHQHAGAVAERIPDLRDQVDGRYRPVQLPSAVVGQLNAVRPGLDGAAGVGRAERALDDQLAREVLAQLGDVVPGDAGAEPGDAARDRARLEVGGQVREPDGRVAQHTYPVGGPRADAGDGGDGQFGRYDQPVVLVADAEAGDRRVDRHHERAVPAVRGPPHQLQGESVVLEHVQLEPDVVLASRPRPRGQVLDRGGAHGRQRVREFPPAGGPRDGDLPVRVHHPAVSGRGHRERHGQLPAEQPGTGVDPGYVDEMVGPEPPAAERADVSGHAQLFVRGPVYVVEHRPRDQQLRAPPQVADVMAACEPSLDDVRLHRLHPDELADLPDVHVLEGTVRARQRNQTGFKLLK